MECYCDYDESPTIEEANVRRAKLRHKCYECGADIQPGEQYESARMLFEGSWRVDKTCAHCLDVRGYVKAHAPCFCWYHGSLLQDARDTLEQYGHESAGFYIGGMKRVLRAERRKTPNVRGNLEPTR